MSLNIIGIRKEDEKKKYERRSPLIPADIVAIKQEYPEADFIVEPGAMHTPAHSLLAQLDALTAGQTLPEQAAKAYTYPRAFTDDEYRAVGARVGDLNDAKVILGIKEVPIHDILPERVYLNFSHTYKAQPYNMNMLRKYMALGCTLIDYELIVKDVDDAEYALDKHPREVFFGHFAGYVGAVNSLSALGQRLDYEGLPNPFSVVKQGMDYHRNVDEDFGDFATAMQHLETVGQAIRTEGFDAALGPVIFGVSGGGNVARAIIEVFKHLPIIRIKPADLLGFNPSAEEMKHHIYLVQFRREDRADLALFERYLRRVMLFMNGIKWMPGDQRLVTRAFLKDLYAADDQPVLRVIGDVSCDPNGGIEICEPTYPANPSYIYEPHLDDLDTPWSHEQFTAATHFGVDGRGVVVMAVTNLPAEFPRDAATAFSAMMKPFIPALLTADFTAPFEDLALPRQLKRAVIVHQGKLAPDFAYLAESLPKRVLVLGAGLMSPAVIDYLLGSGYEVIVSDAQLDQAQKRIEPYAYASVKAIHLPIGVENYGHLVHAAQKVDVVVSLLPAGLHPIAAAACIEARTHLVTASYISEAMRALDPFAKQAGVILLNEVGLDPGMDHMSAMRVIHDVHGKSGRITAFTSYCGGLPEPSVANNPLRFKASWSPAGIVSAANRPARVKQDGAVRDYAPRQLFDAPLLMDFEGIPHRLEAYPNGDSTAYIDLYELPEAETFIRGTLRYEGWSEIIAALHDLGWFTDALAADVVAKTQAADLAEPVRAVVDWLGLTQAPETPTDAYSYLFAQFKAQPDLAFGPNERDLVLMRHSFTVEYPDGKRELITSSLVVTGEANGLSAMAATVGYTSAICARVIIEGLFRSTGVQMPLSPKLYNVVLDELASLPFGLGFDEAYHPLA